MLKRFTANMLQWWIRPSRHCYIILFYSAIHNNLVVVGQPEPTRCSPLYVVHELCLAVCRWCRWTQAGAEMAEAEAQRTHVRTTDDRQAERFCGHVTEHLLALLMLVCALIRSQLPYLVMHAVKMYKPSSSTSKPVYPIHQSTHNHKIHYSCITCSFSPSPVTLSPSRTAQQFSPRCCSCTDINANYFCN